MSNKIVDDYIESDEDDEYAKIVIEDSGDLISPEIYEEYSEDEDEDGDEYYTSKLII